jgi:cell division protein FtsL
VEGVSVGPKERKRRIGRPVEDRRHRRNSRRRRRQDLQWTTGEKIILILGIVLALVTVILAIVLFVL